MIPSVLPLGSLCPIKRFIRALHIQPTARLPFDWIETRYIETVIQSLQENFQSWLKISEWFCPHIHKPNMCPLLMHRTLNIRAPHDLQLADLHTPPRQINQITDESGFINHTGIRITLTAMNTFISNYNRRIQRFRSIARRSCVKIFVRWEFQSLSQIQLLFQTLRIFCDNTPFVLVAVYSPNHTTKANRQILANLYPTHNITSPVYKSLSSSISKLHRCNIIEDPQFPQGHCWIACQQNISSMKKILQQIIKQYTY